MATRYKSYLHLEWPLEDIGSSSPVAFSFPGQIVHPLLRKNVELSPTDLRTFSPKRCWRGLTAMEDFVQKMRETKRDLYGRVLFICSALKFNNLA